MSISHEDILFITHFATVSDSI